MEVVDIKRSDTARLAIRMFLVVRRTLLVQKAARREKLVRVPTMMIRL